MFDKTGTLTEGRFEVISFQAVNNNEEELLRLAASVEKGSKHPLAEAIVATLIEEPTEGLPQLIRCGLIDATLSSIVSNVPTDLIRDLARLGQWNRALSVANLNTGRKGPGLQAVVEGLLHLETAEELNLAREVANQIRNRGDDAINRARAMASVAARMTKVPVTWLAPRRA